jgi:hypothetical protein
LTTWHSAIFVDNSDSAKGHTVVNCSFENLKGSGYTVAIHIFNANANINISDSIFRNITTSHGASSGAVYYSMNTNYKGHYNISENTFIEVSANKSVIHFVGTFLSLTFNYNSFYSVSSTTQGGVYLFFE